MPPRKKNALDSTLSALRRAAADPTAPGSQELLDQALRDKDWLLVSTAAKIVGDHTLRGFELALRAVWPRFCQNVPKSDPGCRAKEAALSALDFLETLDPEPFLAAIRYHQFEPALGARVDTAGGVRVRALLGLLRQCHADSLLYAGELLADPDPQVRAGVAQGLGHFGERPTAALLVHKLRIGDQDPAVLSESAAALLRLTDRFGRDLLAAMLGEQDEVGREVAALTLSQSADPEVVGIVLTWTQQTPIPADLELGIRALGLSRLPTARAFLLDMVRDSAAPRARLAVQALAVHGYEPELLAQVRAAAEGNPRANLDEVITRAFSRR